MSDQHDKQKLSVFPGPFQNPTTLKACWKLHGALRKNEESTFEELFHAGLVVGVIHAIAGCKSRFPKAYARRRLSPIGGRAGWHSRWLDKRGGANLRPYALRPFRQQESRPRRGGSLEWHTPALCKQRSVAWRLPDAGRHNRNKRPLVVLQSGQDYAR